MSMRVCVQAGGWAKLKQKLSDESQVLAAIKQATDNYIDSFSVPICFDKFFTNFLERSEAAGDTLQSTVILSLFQAAYPKAPLSCNLLQGLMLGKRCVKNATNSYYYNVNLQEHVAPPPPRYSPKKSVRKT